MNRRAWLAASAIVLASIPAVHTPVPAAPLSDAADPGSPIGRDAASGTSVVEIVSSGWPTADHDDPGAIRAAVADVGGRVVDEVATGVILAEVPAGLVDQLAASVAGRGATLRVPLELDARPSPSPIGAVDPPPDGAPRISTTSVPDHVRVVGADTWHAAGRTGAGVRVGVIDYFHVPTYWNTDRMGPAPVPGVTAFCLDRGADCTPEFFTGAARVGDDHGPAVVEILRDVAPGASIFIGRASTESDYYRLVDWFVAQGVSVVNRSLGSRFDGPGDGNGAVTAVADYAAGRGILWVNSAGNNAEDRYYRHPVRLVGNLVAFGSSGSDTWLRFRGCATPGGVRWANDWYLPPSQRTDYDVFLHESPAGNPAAGRVVAASTLRQTAGAPPLEVFSGSRCPGPGQALYLQVRIVSGSPAGDVLEIIDFGDGFTAHTQAPYSAAVPVVESRDPGVVSVGAVDPPTSGRSAPYSSQGPTNDGRLKPDLSAPAGSTSVTFGETFSGTSASAPVVAGGAALFLQSPRQASGTGAVGDLLRHSVVDRGVPGRDNVYGTGEFRLPPPPEAAVPAAPPSRYVPLPSPVRALDTRSTSPIGPPGTIGDRWPGRIVELPVSAIRGAPTSGVTAVVANVTVVDSQTTGYTQAFPTRRSVLGGFSNLNADSTNQTRPNFAVIPVGADGRISIYSTSGGHLLVDVLGTFVATTGAVRDGRLETLASAQRVLDTRNSPGRVPVATGQQITVPLPAVPNPSHVAAVVMNVTATETEGFGYVQALPAGRDGDIGLTSTLNLSPGLTMANTVIVPVSGQGTRLFVDLGPRGRTHLIADVTGYITSSSAPVSERGRFVPVRPGRSLDTRSSTGPITDGGVVDVRGASTPGVALPSGTTAAVWNLTVTGTTSWGFLTAWPAGATEPRTSAINWVLPGTTVANAAIVPPNADGVLRIRASAGGTVGGPLTQAVVDLFGYFT